jgi:Bacterial membrane protein YfhO
LGSSLLALFLALEIKANHIQMTYYLLIALLILLIIEFYHAVRNKTLPVFFKSLIYIGCATLLAVAVNASTLWSTAEYASDSIRGKSNLTQNTKEASTGVLRSYAYEFSEGVGETLTFLIPNAYGGASSGQTSDDSHVAKLLVEKGADASQAQSIAQSLPLYWGEKRFTEGPWYFGAIVVFLFIFGLFVIKDRIKWWLLATVILTMLLSFGSNFPLVSDLFFDHFPLYNKFRAVESILAVASLCFPIMAFLAIKEAIDNPDKKALFNKAKIALYITGGLTLIIALLPDLFLSFKSSNHQQLVDGLTQMARGDSGLGNALASALIQDRISAARADAIRTLIFLVIGFGILWAYFKQKINVLVLSLLLLAVTLVDLWTVDKRYLKDEYYTERQENPSPQPREVDTFIAKDTDPDFKVLDLSQSIMQDATTPFFNKSFGGYSAARTKRIDEVVDNQFSKSVNQDILDMMNVKYIITQDPKTNSLSMRRSETACGHAWFVKSVKFVKDADQEMQAITAFAPKEEAIVDQSFKSKLTEGTSGFDPNGSIKLVKYSPDDMVYESGSTIASVAVFSEVYYNKGWKMYIDGKEAPYFRADYLLRAAQLPIGNHKVEFIFHPASYYTGEKISLAGSILLILALGGAAYTGFKKNKEEGKKKAA